MDKEYILKKVTQFITLLSPMMIFILKEQPYVIFLLPILSTIIEIFLDYYFNKKDFKAQTKNLPSITITQDYSSNNDAYHQMCWYITKKCTINKLALKSFYKELYGVKSTKDIPLYTLDDNLETEFIYNGEKVFVTIITSDYINIILFSNLITTLQNVIYTCAEEYKNYINQGEKSYYHLYSLGSDDYKNEWTSHPINVIKTKSNVFLSERNSIIFESIEKFYQSRHLYDAKGMTYKKGILLYGIPGTGKSSVVYATAYEFKMNIYKVSLLNMNDNNLLKHVRSIPPKSIMLIEDIDTIKTMHERTIDDDEESETKKSKHFEKQINLETMLNILDGYTFLHECIIFCTTNHIDKLDPALIRCGRMDEQYEFTFASKKQIKEMLEFYDVGHLYEKYCDKKITTAELTQICWHPSFLKIETI